MNTNTQQTEANEVANTILAQLGGVPRLVMMCGCKQFLAGKQSVQFKIGRNEKKITAAVITRDANDTYELCFFTGATLKKAHSGAYAEDLVRLFEDATGMYLSF